MPDINITVRDKIAKAEGSPEIVCGNSDYAVVFDLDFEWDTYDLKTMRVVWIDIMTEFRDTLMFRLAEILLLSLLCIMHTK